MNPSQQGTAPSPKMVTQSTMALFAAIYIDSGREIARLKAVLFHVGLLEGGAHANAAMVDIP